MSSILNWLEPALLILGLLVFLYSLIAYLRRTGDGKSILLFWQAKLALTEEEHRLNRMGIGIMLGGILLRFINAWMQS